MESLLQKWGWVGHLLIIALIAVLLATAVNKTVAIYLAPYTVPEVPEFAKAAKPADSKKSKPRAQSYAQGITKRCLFGCPEETPEPTDCPEGCPDGQVCQEGACVEPDPNAGVPSELPIASDIAVKLLGAMVADDADFSVALFSDEGSKATYILGVGEQLMGQAEIVEIRRDRVILKRGNRLEYIRLQDSLSGAPTLASTYRSSRAPTGLVAPNAPAPLGGDPEAGKLAAAKDAAKAVVKAEGVKVVGENEYELDSAIVEAKLNDAEGLARGAKVIPNYEDGKKAGIKLVGIRGDSVYSQLGIQSGDVVTSINGTKIKNQAHAIELLQKMRGAKEASIEVQRRGKAEQLKYRVK